jgi:hypothetical protein
VYLSHIEPTRTNHRLLWLRRAALRAVVHLATLGGEDELRHYGFLQSYLDEVRALLPPVESLPELETAWAAALQEWERAAIDSTFPLSRLVQSGLTPAHLEALMLAGLVEEDARFGVLFSALHPFPDEIRLTVGLLNDLLRDSDGWQIASDLARRGLLTIAQPERPRAARPLSVPGAVWDACRGTLEASSGITRYPASHFPELHDLSRLFAADTTRRLTRLPDLLTSKHAGGVILRGMRGSGRRRALGSIARAMGCDVLAVHAEKEPLQLIRLLGPLALMLGALPVISLELSPGETLDMPALAGYSGPLGIVLGQDGSVRGEAVATCVTIAIPPPGRDLRRERWASVLNPHLNGNQQTIDELSASYHLTLEGVERSGRLALAYAALDGRQHIQPADVQEACRALGQQSLESLASRVETGGTWDELIVPEMTRAELHSLVLRCRQREAVLAHLGAGFRGATRGVRALLAGPSGTGKTLAVRIIAAELGLDLYRIDLSAVVSKYIGETERNLSRLFARAEEQDIILLLDEGDSLMTGRTDVRTSNDRYANMETNYLLQRLEHYQGIFLVTTNAMQRIDGAFQRRMDACIEFSAPGTAQRYDIWRLHLPVNHTVNERFLRTAAARCNLSGGQIRNAALHATVLAVENRQPLCQDNLNEGIAREYRKMGAASPLG